jgi:hypothetical protein
MSKFSRVPDIGYDGKPNNATVAAWKLIKNCARVVKAWISCESSGRTKFLRKQSLFPARDSYTSLR